MTHLQPWGIDTGAPLQSFMEWLECPVLLRQSLIGPISWQRRNEFSVGQALRNLRLAPEWVAALLAWGATVSLRDATAGETCALADVLARKGEARAIKLLHVSRVDTGTSVVRRWGEAHVARTPADEPIVSVIVVVDLADGVVQEARIALTGVWQVPVALGAAANKLLGNGLTPVEITTAAAAVRQEVRPQRDFRGSAKYRRNMAFVLTRRALQRCQDV